MAGELSTVGSAAALTYIMGLTPTITPTFNTYLALCVGTIGDDTTMATLPEVTTTGYARTQITWGAVPVTNPPIIANSTLVTFPAVTANMTQPVISAALVTSSSGTTGNYLAWWTLSNPITLLTGQQLQISVGKLTMQLT